MTETLFPLLADAVRKLAEERGYEVYVSMNNRSVTLSKPIRGMGREEDFHIKVRRVPHGRK